MRFDFISFLLGFVSASVVFFILYRMRAQLGAARRNLEAQAGAAGKSLSNTAEGRYTRAIIQTMDTYHAAGEIVKLSEIYIEPRFIGPAPLVDPNEEKASTVFHVVPQLHEFPAAYAPYNLPTLSIGDLRSGERHLALLGMPGAGKSTTLAILGLVAAGVIVPPALDLMADPVFDEELKGLPPDEQEKRIRQREELQRRALAQLQNAQANVQKNKEKDKSPEVQHKTVDFSTLLPILVHMRDIDLRPEAFGVDATQKAAKARPVDPAEPLVRAIQQQIGGVAASFAPRVLYKRLNEGTAMVLIDGYDELPPALRAEKLEWLARFIEIYGANFIVVAGPHTGYDPLLAAGLSPCFLRAWSDADYDGLVAHWGKAWTEYASNTKGVAAPDEKVLKRLGVNNRGRLPLDVTFKIWAALSNDEKEQGRRGWYDFFVRRYLPNADLRPTYEKLAAALLDNDGQPLSRDQIKAVLAPPAPAEGAPAAAQPANIDELVNRVIGGALLTGWAGGSYGFCHPLVGAYLAAETLADATVTDASAKAAWTLAIPFAAIRLPMEGAVNRHLSSPPDLMYNRLFDMVAWLLDSPTNASWRAEVFRRLAAALIGPSQYPLIRRRAMAALVATRDKGVLFVLKQALSSANALVRTLGCVGLGALGDTDPIKDLEPMLKDSDPDVQLAAGLALGAIGTDKALETMTSGLVNGEPSLRRAVAEALAALPGVGHETLREAVGASDMMMRHAAVFGLARIKSAWSLSLLYRTLLEDEQWYVRNAAEQAFQDMERPERGGIMKYPEADSLTWLVAWAAERGEGVPAGPNSRQVLIRVLQEGDPERRAAAAETLALLGHIAGLKPLYGALRDKEEKVRAAVFDSLGKLQVRMGQTLPNPG